MIRNATFTMIFKHCVPDWVGDYKIFQGLFVRVLPLGTWEITALEMPITSVQLFPQVGCCSVSSLTWLLTVTLGYGLVWAGWLGNWVQFSGRKFDDEVSITDNATAAKRYETTHIKKPSTFTTGPIRAKIFGHTRNWSYWAAAVLKPLKV